MNATKAEFLTGRFHSWVLHASLKLMKVVCLEVIHPKWWLWQLFCQSLFHGTSFRGLPERCEAGYIAWLASCPPVAIGLGSVNSFVICCFGRESGGCKEVWPWSSEIGPKKTPHACSYPPSQEIVRPLSLQGCSLPFRACAPCSHSMSASSGDGDLL